MRLQILPQLFRLADSQEAKVLAAKLGQSPDRAGLIMTKATRDALFDSAKILHDAGWDRREDVAEAGSDQSMTMRGISRVDDVINVAGHRLSTMKIESALVSHPKVAEAAVVGKPDPLKGQGILAFVTLESGQTPTEELKQELREHVAKEIGALARPDDIRFTDSLPKTRSGKFRRRHLRDVDDGRESTDDTTTQG